MICAVLRVVPVEGGTCCTGDATLSRGLTGESPAPKFSMPSRIAALVLRRVSVVRRRSYPGVQSHRIEYVNCSVLYAGFSVGE